MNSNQGRCRMRFCHSAIIFLLSSALVSVAGARSPATAASTAPTSQPAVVKVACVGDSITQGVGVRDSAADSYPSCLRRMLGARFDVRNFGVSGTTALTAGDSPYVKTPEYVAAQSFVPDVVVMMLGTNDSKHRGDGSLDSNKAPENWTHKDEFAGDYAAILTAFARPTRCAGSLPSNPCPPFPAAGASTAARSMKKSAHWSNRRPALCPAQK